MIIECINCHKKFEIDSSLIPNDGRMLLCSSCNHKWFFKTETKNEPISPTGTKISNENIKTLKEKEILKAVDNPESINLLDNVIVKDPEIEEISKNNENSNKDLQIIHSKNEKKYNLLSLIIVFILSFIGIIIVLDTFQDPISKIVPNIEFLLYSLYETINDIKLFLKDLI